MSNITWDFDTPADYEYDGDKIKIESSIAKLYKSLIPLAYYKLNSSSGTTAIDSSSNGHDGTLVNSPTWVSGKLGNCLNFNGSNQYVDIGDVSTSGQSISIEFFIKFNAFNENYAIIRKGMVTSNNLMPYFIFYTSSQDSLRFGFYDNAFKYIEINNVQSTFSTDWHHVVCTYDGDSNIAKMYLDGIESSSNTLSGTRPKNSESAYIGAFPVDGSPHSQFFNGRIDNMVIYEEVLTSSQVSDRYNSGNGDEDFNYAIDKPTIEPSTLENPYGNVSWEGFTINYSAENQGNIGVNLYKEDKNFKYYWNGSNWVSGGDVSHYNSPSVINDNISSFIADDIGFVLYLISDGDQKVEVDSIQMTYSSEQPPNVNAGANKSCKDGQYKKPFSDAIISDPDGDINDGSAEAKIGDGSWTNISKSGYATLQEAIRNYQYQFNTTGDITCQLKITDDQSKESTDSMIMTVSKYTVTFEIKDGNDNHLPNLQVSYDDGSGWHSVNSPWTYDLEYKSSGWAVTLDKFGFSTKTITVSSTEHTENVTMDRISADPQQIADAVWNAVEAQDLIFKIKKTIGLNQENYRFYNTVYDSNNNLISGTIKIYNNATDCENDTNPIATYSISSTYNADGTLNDYKVVEE